MAGKAQIFTIFSFTGKVSKDHVYFPLLAVDVFKPLANGLRAVLLKTTVSKRATNKQRVLELLSKPRLFMIPSKWSTQFHN